jgi:urocanate hydratase
MEITLSNTLPPYPTFVEGIRRAPDRGYTLTPAQTATALKNALRYVPKELHETLAPEFMEELRTRGRIYGYRYRPQGDLKAKPIDAYKGNCIEGKLQSPNQKIPDRKTKCVIKTHLNIKQNVILGANLKPV